VAPPKTREVSFGLLVVVPASMFAVPVKPPLKLFSTQVATPRSGRSSRNVVVAGCGSRLLVFRCSHGADLCYGRPPERPARRGRRRRRAPRYRRRKGGSHEPVADAIAPHRVRDAARRRAPDARRHRGQPGARVGRGQEDGACLFGAWVIDTASLGTYFSCTSTDTKTIFISVEVFNAGGFQANDPSTFVIDAFPGETHTIGTHTAAGIPSGSLNVSTNGGSARILSTSKSLVCTAFVADRVNTPPQTSWSLTIIAKTKQKAAN
jgi:hypothetical protein